VQAVDPLGGSQLQACEGIIKDSDEGDEQEELHTRWAWPKQAALLAAALRTSVTRPGAPRQISSVGTSSTATIAGASRETI